MGRRQRIAGCVLAAAVLLAACGGSDGGEDGAAAPDTEAAGGTEVAAPASAAATTTAAPTTVAPTTEPSTTVAPTSEPSTTEADATFGRDAIEGDWIVVRKVTEDADYWQVDYSTVEYRTYTLSCNDDTCTSLSAIIGYGDGTVDQDAPLQLALDADSMTAADTLPAACLNPAGTDYDGPATTTWTTVIDLAPQVVGGVTVSFVGTYQVDVTGAASADCAAEQYGYTSDMVMFREDLATPMPFTDGVWSGEGAKTGEERGIVGCAQGACAFRMALNSIGPGDVVTLIQVDVPFTETPTGVGSGQSVASGNCRGDISGHFEAADAYTVTRFVEVRQYEIAGVGTPVLVATDGRVGEPVAGLAPDVAAECGPFSAMTTFAGVPTDDPLLVSLG